MKSTTLFCFFFLISPMAFSIERNESFEYLTPREKILLETGIEESEFPRLCPHSKLYAEKSQWNHSFKKIKADYLLVDKKRRLLHLLNQGEILATYRIALGGNPVGDKVAEGDLKTPEGLYFFDLKNRQSDYHLSLRINYPNSQDLADAKRKGIEDPGKDIMIHGLPNSWLKRKFIRHPNDWTKGCIAVTSYEVIEIFESVDLGTMIEICP